MKYLVNTLATHEVHVADYYLRRGAYIAAVNRAQDVLKNYAGTPATEDALAIVIRGYDALGMKDLRDDTERVMRRNFPNSRFYAKGLGLTKPQKSSESFRSIHSGVGIARYTPCIITHRRMSLYVTIHFAPLILLTRWQTKAAHDPDTINTGLHLDRGVIPDLGLLLPSCPSVRHCGWAWRSPRVRIGTFCQ